MAPPRGKPRLKRVRPLPTVGRSSLKNLADPSVRGLLNRIQQLVSFDGHVKVCSYRVGGYMGLVCPINDNT